MAAAADVMDMDKAECSIGRILPVRHPRCPESNNYALRINLGARFPELTRMLPASSPFGLPVRLTASPQFDSLSPQDFA
jgi:hypothetical protein